MHQTTCIVIAAFGTRLIPWLDLDTASTARGLGKVSKQLLAYVSHGKYRQRLIHTLSNPMLASNRIIWISEQWSSCICSRCNRYNGYLGRSRIFYCPHKACGAILDRDANAAQNIWRWGLLWAAAECGAADRLWMLKKGLKVRTSLIPKKKKELAHSTPTMRTNPKVLAEIGMRCEFYASFVWDCV